MSEVEDRAKRSGKSQRRLPLPPYGRELAEARRRGEAPNVFVHAGDHSWDRAKSRQPPEVLCLPPEADPAEYDWTCCRGLAVTLITWNRPPGFIDRFARRLVIDGAALVAALSEGGSTFYRPRAR